MQVAGAGCQNEEPLDTVGGRESYGARERLVSDHVAVVEADDGLVHGVEWLAGKELGEQLGIRRFLLRCRLAPRDVAADNAVAPTALGLVETLVGRLPD